MLYFAPAWKDPCLLSAKVLLLWLCVHVESLKQSNFAEASPTKPCAGVDECCAVCIQRYKQRQENHGKSRSVTSAYRASGHGCQSCRLIMANAGRCFQLAACLPRLLWMQNNGCWMHDDVNCDLRVDKGYFGAWIVFMLLLPICI